MNTNILKNIVPAAAALLLCTGLASCTDDLSKGNIDPTVAGEVDIQGMYNKCYAGLIMEGNDGAADFTIQDAGKSTLIRNIYNLNELPTDEGICWWSDEGLADLNFGSISAGNSFLQFPYYRLMSNITYCNHFLSLGCSDATMNAEVRFLRAYYYFLMTDFFGDPPFTDAISSEAPKQAHTYFAGFDESASYTRAQLLNMGRTYMYSWIESELLAIEPDMLPAEPELDTEANYGRADKAAAWLLLSRLYLNAEVYTGTPQWAKAKEYAEKVINSSYELFNVANTAYVDNSGNSVHSYDMLFMGNNGSNGASREAILPLLQDGEATQGWGGSLFFIAAHWNAEMETVTGNSAGTTGNTWAGMRVRPEFVKKFISDPTRLEGLTTMAIRGTVQDDRALLWGVEHTADLGNNTSFADGLAIPKWNNNYAYSANDYAMAMAGQKALAQPHNDYYVDTDFFLFRKAEAYLTYVEADLHINGSANEQDRTYMNMLRSRANTSLYGTTSAITLSEVLDERAREFYCEGQRRTDLIRNGQYGGPQATYQWSYKNGTKNGTNFESFRNVFPIPEAEIKANSNLTQINGYN